MTENNGDSNAKMHDASLGSLAPSPDPASPKSHLSSTNAPGDTAPPVSSPRVTSAPLDGFVAPVSGSGGAEKFLNNAVGGPKY